MKRMTMAVLALMLVLAACAGNSSEDSALRATEEEHRTVVSREDGTIGGEVYVAPAETSAAQFSAARSAGEPGAAALDDTAPYDATIIAPRPSPPAGSWEERSCWGGRIF